jgi:hypothetical protein
LLERDAGNDYTSAFVPVSNYAGTALSFGASTVDGLVLGRTYRFRSRSQNGIGLSDFSDIAYIAYGDVPPTPAAPLLVYSTQTSISVNWV